MDIEDDELQKQINLLGLYVDLSELMLPNNHLRYFGDSKKQVLTIKTVDRLNKVEITLPDKIFEWFIDVNDLNNQTLVSTWVDHYGDTDENLKLEMRNEIQNFIEIVSKKDTRVIDKGLNSKTFQYIDGQTWCDFDIF